MKVGRRKDRQPWGAVAGFVTSYKLNLPIRWWGILMYETLLHLEFDPGVIQYAPRPHKISKLLPSGELFTLEPHFSVVRPEGNVIVLCKWRQSLETWKGQTELEVASSWAAMNDYSVEIVTEKELRTRHKFRNIKLLWRYRYGRVTKETLDLINSYLRDVNGTPTLGTLASLIADPVEPYPLMQLPILYSLLFHGHLSADFDTPITAASKVWTTTEADQGRRSPFILI